MAHLDEKFALNIYLQVIYVSGTFMGSLGRGWIPIICCEHVHCYNFLYYTYYENEASIPEYNFQSPKTRNVNYYGTKISTPKDHNYIQ